MCFVGYALGCKNWCILSRCTNTLHLGGRVLVKDATVVKTRSMNEQLWTRGKVRGRKSHWEPMPFFWSSREVGNVKLYTPLVAPHSIIDHRAISPTPPSNSELIGVYTEHKWPWPRRHRRKCLAINHPQASLRTWSGKKVFVGEITSWSPYKFHIITTKAYIMFLRIRRTMEQWPRILPHVNHRNLPQGPCFCHGLWTQRWYETQRVKGRFQNPDVSEQVTISYPSYTNVLY